MSKIHNMLNEQRTYLPPRHGKDIAKIRNKREFDHLRQYAQEDSDAFWAERAASLLHWYKQWDTVDSTDFSIPKVAWFEGGKLNAAFNCVDRHNITEKRTKAALIWQGERDSEVKAYTYQMLYTEICHLASVLNTLGVKKGDRVALYLPMIPELVISMLACARIGAVHTAIFTGYAEGGVQGRIFDCEAKLVITADCVMRNGEPKPLKANLDKILNSCPSVEKVIVVNRGNQKIDMLEGRDMWWEDLMNDYNLDPDYPCESMDAMDPLFILHTSGSTGKPTGVVHSTGGYLTYAAHTTQWVFDMKDCDVYWCTADCGWITGHTYLVYGPLALGATTIMFEGTPTWPKADRFWKIIEKFRVNIFYTAPTVLRSLMRLGNEWTEMHDLSSLRILGSVGEPMNPEAWMWYHTQIGKEDLPIVDTWWQTESGGALLSPLPYASVLKPGSVSKPLPGIEARVMNIDGTEDSYGTGDGGHLCIKKGWPGLMTGVYKNPEKFASYFKQFPGYFWSGDGVRIDEDGHYFMLGRMDDSINVSGHRLSTAEIESVLVAHDKVGEVGVVPMPHDIKGEAIYAYVALIKGVEWTDELRTELRQYVRKKIGALASPDRIQFVEELPKTLSGKILRRILRKIASNEYEAIGDVTSLAHPETVDQIIAGHKNLLQNLPENGKPAQKINKEKESVESKETVENKEAVESKDKKAKK